MPSDYQWKQQTFWEHYCEAEKDIMGTASGQECSWCGQTESDLVQATRPKHKLTTGERLYGYHPQELLTNKILPIDVFYKLFRSENGS